jgi:hypothetical protein
LKGKMVRKTGKENWKVKGKMEKTIREKIEN